MTKKVTNSKDISRRSICQLCFVHDCYVSDKRTLSMNFIVTLVERFSLDFRKTKTKVNTLANQRA